LIASHDADSSTMELQVQGGILPETLEHWPANLHIVPNA